MLNEGIVLMSVGMGTVFSFLVILLFAVLIMGNIVSYLNKLFPEQIKKTSEKIQNVCDDTAIAIAIAAAKIKN